MTAKAWAALLLVGGIWGASFLFIRVALDEVSPLQVVLFRVILGAAVLSALLSRQRLAIRLTPGRALALVALAFVSTVVPFFLISWAETRIASGTAAVLNATMPIFTLLLAAATLRDEHLTAKAVGGGVLGVVGVVLLSGGASGFKESGLLGDIAVIGATACYAIGNIMVRFLVRSLPGLAISTSNITVSALAVSAIALAVDRPRFDLSWDVWASMAALGFFGTGVAYIAYYWLIEHAGSFRSSLVTYIIPVVGVILGATVLGESIRASTIAGGALIVLGVAVGTGAVETALRGWSYRARVTAPAERP